MELLKLTQAAKLVDASRSTIFRAAKNGQMSVKKDKNGQILIDPAELFRVFPQSTRGNSQKRAIDMSDMIHDVGDIALKTEVDGLRRLVENHETTIRDLRTRLDSSESERRSLSTMVHGLLTRDAERGEAFTQPSQPEKRTNWVLIGATTLITGLVIALVYAIKTNGIAIN